MTERSDRELLRRLKNSAAEVFHLFYNYDPVDQTVQCVECGSWANVEDRMKHSPSCSVNELFMRQQLAHERCEEPLDGVEAEDGGVLVQVNNFRTLKPPLSDFLKLRVCCSSFAKGLYSGTDNEEYGSAVHLVHPSEVLSESRWEDGDVLEPRIGSLRESLSFCPFCGRELDDLPRIEI